MDCQRAQDEILESFVGSRPGTVPSAVEAHLAECPACAAFAARQHAVEIGLSAALVPPVISAHVRQRVRDRILRERRRYWSDLLPDVVHFGSCAVATVLGVLLLPLSPPVVLTLGFVGTLVTHAILNVARESLDAIEERHG
jgi:anti-sigma factor RsiW